MLDNEQKIIDRALSVLDIEARAILELRNRIDRQFVTACHRILHCEGRVIVTGMGKSGHIARKIAATFASTGTPAIFLHPAEASHGDLGMITPKDILILISNSGETDELLLILPIIKRSNIFILSLTGNPDSNLAALSDIHLNVRIHQEACPLGLAPTASTTATLAMGDALALSVLEMRGFTAEDFAKSHPSGRLGKRLLLTIQDIMHVGQAIPKISENASLIDAVLEMTQKRLGFTTIVSETEAETLVGIFTDGDLRRTLEQGLNLHQTPIRKVMTKTFKVIQQKALAFEAIPLMEKEPKSLGLPVLNEAGKLIGAFNMHDLLSRGVL